MKHDERSIQRILYWRHRSSAVCLLPNYTPWRWYECDLFVVTNAMYSIEYEIKLTRSDFKADFRKRRKHQHLKRREEGGPTRFFYVTPEDLVSPDEVPEYAGLMHICPHPLIVKGAPRLSDKKHAEAIVNDMRRVSCYRFWNERMNFGIWMEQHEKENRCRVTEASK